MLASDIFSDLSELQRRGRTGFTPASFLESFTFDLLHYIMMEFSLQWNSCENAAQAF